MAVKRIPLFEMDNNKADNVNESDLLNSVVQFFTDNSHFVFPDGSATDLTKGEFYQGAAAALGVLTGVGAYLEKDKIKAALQKAPEKLKKLGAMLGAFKKAKKTDELEPALADAGLTFDKVEKKAEAMQESKKLMEARKKRINERREKEKEAAAQK